MHIPGKRNRECVVRRQRCGRVFSGSHSVFVATPMAESVALELDVVKSVLREFEIEPYIAVESFDPAKDVFCEKICTKVIESQFCIVLLTDPVINDRVTPNPNVYYEYGLMTAFSKKIIPFQRKDHALGFNVQSFDTIKYTSLNLRSRLSEAVALVMTQISEPVQISEHNRKSPKKILLAFMELAGYRSFPNQSFVTYNTKITEHNNWKYSVAITTSEQINDYLVQIRLVCERLSRYSENPPSKNKYIERWNCLREEAMIVIAVADLELLDYVHCKINSYVFPDFLGIVIRPIDDFEEMLHSDAVNLNNLLVSSSRQDFC